MVNEVEEGRKRVLSIIAGILVARHLKTPEDIDDNRPSPRTEPLVASAVRWAERIMRRIDGVFEIPPMPEDGRGCNRDFDSVDTSMKKLERDSVESI
jgi:hypothetical protein